MEKKSNMQSFNATKSCINQKGVGIQNVSMILFFSVVFCKETKKMINLIPWLPFVFKVHFEFICIH